MKPIDKSPNYFNPRSPHGERRRQEPLGTVCPEISIHAPSTGSDRWDRPKTSGKGISIHAPRTGSDKRRPVARRKPQTFQSTLPARGATLQRDYHGALDVVFQSTLPARGATRMGGQRKWRCLHFNPRSPHGERQRKVTILSIRIIGFAQKVYHKTVLLRISLAENAVILPEKP